MIRERINLKNETNIDISQFQTDYKSVNSVHHIQHDILPIQQKESIETVVDGISKLTDVLYLSPDGKIKYVKRMKSGKGSNYESNVFEKELHIDDLKDEEINFNLPEIMLYQNPDLEVILTQNLIIDAKNVKLLKEMFKGALDAYSMGKKKARSNGLGEYADDEEAMFRMVASAAANEFIANYLNNPRKSK